MMKFIQRFLFTPSMNTFDVFCILTISSLIVNHSWWWFIAYAVTIPISGTMQTVVENTKD
jgi:hypothetical protein